MSDLDRFDNDQISRKLDQRYYFVFTFHFFFQVSQDDAENETFFVITRCRAWIHFLIQKRHVCKRFSLNFFQTYIPSLSANIWCLDIFQFHSPFSRHTLLYGIGKQSSMCRSHFQHSFICMQLSLLRYAGYNGRTSRLTEKLPNKSRFMNIDEHRFEVKRSALPSHGTLLDLIEPVSLCSFLSAPSFELTP